MADLVTRSYRGAVMKVPYGKSEEYSNLFEPPYIVAELIGITIILGGFIAHVLYR